MESLEFIRGANINQALEKKYRQYLTGHLQYPQEHLEHIDDDIEIGISYYQAFTADTPHKHPIATEHGYVLQGSIKVLVLGEEPQEYQFDAGDFFVLRPGVGYATKNAPGTKILFVKAPGINDKTIIPLTDALTEWAGSWD
ncbi:MAG: cupin domain-containing protein [Ruminococcaceae bacterium]|nr:cupin domain-containing protein [Oscillospiraceae bacterium]